MATATGAPPYSAYGGFQPQANGVPVVASNAGYDANSWAALGPQGQQDLLNAAWAIAPANPQAVAANDLTDSQQTLLNLSGINPSTGVVTAVPDPNATPVAGYFTPNTDSSGVLSWLPAAPNAPGAVLYQGGSIAAGANGAAAPTTNGGTSSSTAPTPSASTGSGLDPTVAALLNDLGNAQGSGGVPGSGSIAGGEVLPQPTTTSGISPVAIIAIVAVLGIVAFILLRKKKPAGIERPPEPERA